LDCARARTKISEKTTLNRKMSIEKPSTKAEIDTQTLSPCRFGA